MSQPDSSADQLRPDAPITPAAGPGSQSSSGMSQHFTDALVDAHQRAKQRNGQPLDIADDAPQGSPIGRSPEATTGPVQD